MKFSKRTITTIVCVTLASQSMPAFAEWGHGGRVHGGVTLRFGGPMGGVRVHERMGWRDHCGRDFRYYHGRGFMFNNAGYYMYGGRPCYFDAYGYPRYYVYTNGTYYEGGDMIALPESPPVVVAPIVPPPAPVYAPAPAPVVTVVSSGPAVTDEEVACASSASLAALGICAAAMASGGGSHHHRHKDADRTIQLSQQLASYFVDGVISPLLAEELEDFQASHPSITDHEQLMNAFSDSLKSNDR